MLKVIGYALATGVATFVVLLAVLGFILGTYHIWFEVLNLGRPLAWAMETITIVSLIMAMLYFAEEGLQRF